MRTIRIAEPALDAAGVAAIYGPIVEATPISFETEPPSVAEMERRIAAVLTFAPWLVCVEEGRLDGYVYASPFRDRAAYRWSVDVTAYVREGCRRSGIGRALYTRLFALLRLQGFCAAHAGITLPNAASVGMHESLGFRRVALYPRAGFKCGAWHDVGWWQLELKGRTGEPAPLVPIDIVRGTEPWKAALA
jgi:phosphinothricin acetyltransferase